MKTELEIDKWNRKSHFNFFKNYDNPFYNICSNIEITELHKYCKDSGSSFFLASLYLSIKAANEIKEFRYRIEGDSVFIYDRVHPSSTVLNEDNTFGFCDFTYYDIFKEFAQNGKISVAETIKQKNLTAKEYRKDVIHYTTIPWISLTGLTHARNFGTEDSIPKIVFGKYFNDNDKLMIPICVEVHHSLVDGYHIGQYLDLFRNYIVNSGSILSNKAT
jgi:chloramphenicol O-acetyltransferase type A